MMCHVCGGTMEDQRVRFCAYDIEHPIMVEDVPARVCDQCGEQVFSSATLDALERIRDGETHPARVMDLRVYEFGDAESSPPGARS